MKPLEQTRLYKVFRLYEKTINKIDDRSEYREITRTDIRIILEDMHKELEQINKGE